MRCRDVKQLLAHQRDTEHMDDSANAAFQAHLETCADCRAFVQCQRSMDALLRMPQKTTQSVATSSFSHTGHVSTNSIMQAVQQQKQISQQLEVLHEQQRYRVARLRKGGTIFAAITFFTLGSIPLLLLAITLVQTDLMVHVLLLLSNVVDVLYVLGNYIQLGLTIVTRNGLLLTGVSFLVVLMMGMWLRLMRSPQEA